MSFLKGLLWFLFALTIVAIAIYITDNYQWADRLSGLFFFIQDKLPLTLTSDQFLVVVTVLSLLVVVLIVSGCATLLVFMGSRLSISRQQRVAQEAASKQEIKQIQEQHNQQCTKLLTLGQTLTKRLDKRVLVQTIVEAASQLTSVSQTNSIISLWLLDIQTDTLRFEMGRYCDESTFTQTSFGLTDPPFSRIVSNQKPLMLAKWQEGLPIIKPDKAQQLGSATGAIVVPLVIESTVLGALVVCCHPDVLKGYDEAGSFYSVMWEELTLGLAIAIQGELAILDRLTGALNREYFMKRLIQEIERANRFQLPLTLLMVDIDNFKLVNDTLGHPQGDAVLKIIARLIRKDVRAIDLVGRYGGEEFIVLLPETGYGDASSNTTGALVVAERIRKAVYDEFCGLQKPLNLTISIGVAVRRFPDDRTYDYQEMIRLADEQLYRAKTSGKNKVCVLVPEKSQEVS